MSNRLHVKISQQLVDTLTQAGTDVYAATMVFAQAHVNERIVPVVVGDPLVMVHQDSQHHEALAVSVEFTAGVLWLLTYEEAFQAGFIETEGLLQ